MLGPYFVLLEFPRPHPGTILCGFGNPAGRGACDEGPKACAGQDAERFVGQISDQPPPTLVTLPQRGGGGEVNQNSDLGFPRAGTAGRCVAVRLVGRWVGT